MLIWWLMALSIVAASAACTSPGRSTRSAPAPAIDTTVRRRTSAAHYLERIYGFAFIRARLRALRVPAQPELRPAHRRARHRPRLRGQRQAARAPTSTRSTWRCSSTARPRSPRGWRRSTGASSTAAVGSLGNAGLAVARLFDGVDTQRRRPDASTASARRSSASARRLRKLQTGFVANYALLMLGLGALIFYLAVMCYEGAVIVSGVPVLSILIAMPVVLSRAAAAHPRGAGAAHPLRRARSARAPSSPGPSLILTFFKAGGGMQFEENIDWVPVDRDALPPRAGRAVDAARVPRPRCCRSCACIFSWRQDTQPKTFFFLIALLADRHDRRVPRARLRACSTSSGRSCSSRCSSSSTSGAASGGATPR